MGMTRNLFSDYSNDQACYEPNYGCVPTIAEAISSRNVGGLTTSASGVDINSPKTDGIAAAVALAKAADVVFLVLGNDKSQEHEGNTSAVFSS